MEDQAYSIIAEPLERDGIGRATLAPREGMAAAVPAQRERPLLTMADMGHGGMSGMDHGNMAGMDHRQMQQSEEPPATEPPMSEMDHAALGHAMPQAPEPAPAPQPTPEMDHAATGPGHPPQATDQPPH